MVNIYVNFAYHENLVNMLGGHGIGINIHGCNPNLEMAIYVLKAAFSSDYHFLSMSLLHYQG